MLALLSGAMSSHMRHGTHMRRDTHMQPCFGGLAIYCLGVGNSVNTNIIYHTNGIYLNESFEDSDGYSSSDDDSGMKIVKWN